MRYGGPAALMPYIGIMETVLETSMHFDNIVIFSLQQYCSYNKIFLLDEIH